MKSILADSQNFYNSVEVQLDEMVCIPINSLK